MEIIYIHDKKFFFGFVKDIPAICSQGESKKEVKSKINKYLKK
jgi:predicted RNase H-like HicB family nuclease